MADKASQDEKMRQLVAKCQADEAFKQKLLADAAGTLKAEGMEPTDLSDEDLDKISGGDYQSVTRDGG